MLRGAALAAALVLASPELAAACSVCTSGRDDATRLAFLLTMLLLSAIPAAFIGGMILYLRRRLRQLDAGASTGGAARGAPLTRTTSSP
jgi:hypothetical protein